MGNIRDGLQVFRNTSARPNTPTTQGQGQASELHPCLYTDRQPATHSLVKHSDHHSKERGGRMLMYPTILYKLLPMVSISELPTRLDPISSV